MSQVSFSCLHCNHNIYALPQQQGMKLLCPNCETTLEVPSLGKEQKKTGGYKEGLKDSAIEYGKQAIAEELGPLARFMNSKRSNEGEFQEEKNSRQKPTIIDRLYTKVGGAIDRYFEKNNTEEGLNKELYSLRVKYKEFSESRKIHATFFISILLVFMLFSVLGGFKFGLVASFFWSGFVGLNKISFLDRVFRFITEIIVLFGMFWMPSNFKDIIAFIMRNLIYLGILLFAAKYIGPVYMVYKIVLFAIDRKDF
jgi:hypothetical protein